jgi:hypothetical protein
LGTSPSKQQRQLIELAAASQSRETVAGHLWRAAAKGLKKAAQLGHSIKGQK